MTAPTTTEIPYEDFADAPMPGALLFLSILEAHIKRDRAAYRHLVGSVEDRVLWSGGIGALCAFASLAHPPEALFEWAALARPKRRFATRTSKVVAEVLGSLDEAFRSNLSPHIDEENGEYGFSVEISNDSFSDVDKRIAVRALIEANYAILAGLLIAEGFRLPPRDLHQRWLNLISQVRGHITDTQTQTQD